MLSSETAKQTKKIKNLKLVLAAQDLRNRKEGKNKRVPTCSFSKADGAALSLAAIRP
jgi:hypothetical protein